MGVSFQVCHSQEKVAPYLYSKNDFTKQNIFNTMSSKPINRDHMALRVKGITGIILAGGKSSRYGENKALVELDGTPLIERVLNIMAPIFQSIIISSNTPAEYEYLGLEIYEDFEKDLGPIGGIYTCLQVIKDEAGFFVACDMPFLNKDLIQHMLDVREDYDIVIPRMGWMLETLHTIYTKNCLPALKKQIDNAVYHTRNLLDIMRVRYVDEDELKSFDPQLKSFVNVNRPDDLSEARLLKGKK